MIRQALVHKIRKNIKNHFLQPQFHLVISTVHLLITRHQVKIYPLQLTILWI